MRLSRNAALALAKAVNWEPPGHLGLPGVIPDDAWPIWQRFEDCARRAIDWRPVVRAEWMAAHNSEDGPDFEAVSHGETLIIVQHDWHGFPDPPEFALHALQDDPPGVTFLGCFDEWPEGWSGGP